MSWWMDGDNVVCAHSDDVVYVHNALFLSCKENMKFAGKWMEPVPSLIVDTSFKF